MASSLEISFYSRSYEGLVEDAKMIGEALLHPGAKLCWNKDRPSFDSKYSICFIEMQGITRMAKSLIGGSVCDAENSSIYSVTWANAVHDMIIKLGIKPEDKKCFEVAQVVFSAQSVLYTKEAKDDPASKDCASARRYLSAAALICSSFHKEDIEEINTLRSKKTYTDVTRESYEKLEWYQLLKDSFNLLNKPGASLEIGEKKLFTYFEKMGLN